MGKRNKRSIDHNNNHNYYRRECEICQQYVEDIYNNWYNNQSFGSNNRQKLLEKTMITSNSSNSHFRRRRHRKSSCGHSCLKSTLIFYTLFFIIFSICVICYASRVFGFIETKSLPLNLNNPRIELYSIITSSVVMLIFLVGLIGSLLESLLCLRIFGAILSYLFLLTFGSSLYLIILLLLSNSSLKLIVSVIACCSAGVILHASLAITPFAFADLIHRERKEQRSETYIKYPSVRYLTASYPSMTYGYPQSGATAHDLNECRQLNNGKCPQSTTVRFEDDWL